MKNFWKETLEDLRLNKYLYLRVFAVFVIPALLMYPSRDREYGISFVIASSTNQIQQSSKEVTINGARSQGIFGTFISGVTNLNFFPGSREVCLKNQNKIFFDGELINPLLIPDGEEGAAMSAKILKNGTNYLELYSRTNTETCKLVSLGFGESVTVSLPEIRNVVPVGPAKFVNDGTSTGTSKFQMKTYQTSHIDLSESRITDNRVVDTSMIFNYIIGLVFISIFITLTHSLIKFITWKW